MPLKSYGVLKGRPIDVQPGTGPSPHYQILISDDTSLFRIAVNVKSQSSPSELLFHEILDFRHPVTAELQALAPGFHRFDRRPGGAALDYVRLNLFERPDMHAVPPDREGPDNDLNEFLARHIQLAMGHEDAMVYAFGERWGPEQNKRDRYFGFLPGNGIHDIHMNQGNVEPWVNDDGVWQDGGLMIHYPDGNGPDGNGGGRWAALFLAFQSQSWNTDDTTGHTIRAPEGTEGRIRIVAALVNPIGHDPGGETVTLLNTTPEPVDLEGWRILNLRNAAFILPQVRLAPGETLRLVLPADTAPLSNEGGILSLLDSDGYKVHGVSYTREEARREGWSLTF
ncbi:hypothetical protein N825_36030 [Skermanella stibiiresistens SB22]|uniref:LTD domain-containing protein n=1 Tax=Skermanella stibiiresistens SB22 TaxID=1385369 RepID=W9GPD8_9PROT|nr:DUF2278 family protein [Skermanella stibiiresistens]EWY35740.1 hypothetical protein N825_36030 [Skermanella stibiiresistens SB22]